MIVDAANLSRNLVLVGQLLAAHTRLIVCLNMTDVAARRGLTVDADALGARLGASLSGWWLRAGIGVDALRRAIGRTVGGETRAVSSPADVPALAPHIGALTDWARRIAAEVTVIPRRARRGAARPHRAARRVSPIRSPDWPSSSS